MRAVHIFPEFENVPSIERLREKYDPLFAVIPPHITLVFPFDSDMSTGILEEHLRETVVGHPPFRMVLQGITGTTEGYLFLNVKVGNDEITALHDRLYTGPLRKFLNRRLTYIPHLTIGRLTDEHSFQTALDETEHFNETFETTVQEIVMETIGPTGESIVELRVPFI